MHSLAAPFIALAALTVIPAVSAHGWVSGIRVNGHEYPAVNISWYLTGKTPSAVWYSLNYGQQNQVFAEAVNTEAISCHIGAVPGNVVVPVRPGDVMELSWSTPEGGPWRTSHEGPVIDYMAKCGKDCRQTTASQLNFFKIAEAGMYKGPHTPGAENTFGTWGTDTLRDNNNVWKVTIPQGLSGPHVLRTEPFALMGADHLGHAQLYPQCINLDIQGSGPGVDPCATGADCRKGPELYKETDPGILISIHVGIDKYIIPGPALWKGVGRQMKRVAKSFTA